MTEYKISYLLTKPGLNVLLNILLLVFFNIITNI